MKRWVGALALFAGTLGTAVFLRRKKTMQAKESPRPNQRERRGHSDRWARPGMTITFRAELMPGRDRIERTFLVAQLLPSGRVTLEGFAGEHTETEFETLRLK